MGRKGSSWGCLNGWSRGDEDITRCGPRLRLQRRHHLASMYDVVRTETQHTHQGHVVDDGGEDADDGGDDLVGGDVRLQKGRQALLCRSVVMRHVYEWVGGGEMRVLPNQRQCCPLP